MGKLLHGIRALIGRDDEFSSNRRHIILANYNASVATSLTTGNFLTGFLLCMGAGDRMLSLFFSITFLGNLLQVFSPLIMERLEKRKSLLIWGKGAQYFLTIVLMGFAPHLSAVSQTRFLILLISFSCAGLLSALTIPGFNVWHIRSIPMERRTFYFAFFNTTNGVATYTLLIFAGLFVDHASAQGELTALLLLRVVAALCALMDLFFLSRVREYDYPATRNRRPRLKTLFSPLRSRPYRLTLALASVWMFASSLPGPYLTAYLLDTLKVGYSFLNLVGVTNLLALLAVSPLWVRLIRRHDSQRVLSRCAIVMAFSYTGMVFLQRQTLFLYPVFMLFNYIATTGVGIVMSNMPFLYLSPENQTGSVGLFSSVITLCAIAGVQVGAVFTSLASGTFLQVGRLTLEYHQQLLLLTAIVLWLTAFVIARLAQTIHKLSVEGEEP